MKKKFTVLIAAAMMLLTMASTAWAQAPAGTTLWADDFSYWVADDVPNVTVNDNTTGVTVYGNGSVTYSVTDGGSATKIYEANLAGGSSPELLISKGGGTFTIANIPTGDATELTLTYKTNNNNNAVSTTTSGVTVTASGSKASTKTYTIATGGASTITLVVTNSASSNTRVDDFNLVVAGGDPTPTTYTVTFDAGAGTFVGNDDFPNTSNTVEAGTYTLPSATPATGFDFDGWLATGNTTLANGSYTVSGNVAFTASYSEIGGGDVTTVTYDFSTTDNFLTSYPGSTHPGTGNTNNLGSFYYTNGDEFTASGTNRYFNTGYFMLGKSGATLQLPTFDFDVEKIVITGRNGASGSVVQNIYVGNNAVSSSTTGATGTNTYVIADGYQAAGTVYTLKVTSAHNTQITEIKVYEKEGGSTAVAVPTFDPVSGTTFGNEGLTVTICQVNNQAIYYTLNGAEPTINSTLYTQAITLTTTTTIKAIAYDGTNTSSVVTATYTYIDPNGPGTEGNPYTVAQARDAIDAGTGTQGVYATGIVSAIPYAYTSNNGITFNMVDNTGDSEFLQAYKCQGDDAPNVGIGDIVVVYGNLTKYNTTYEFGQGCQVVSLTHPVVTTPSVTVTPTTINAPYEGANGTLAIAYENIPDLISFDYYFCDANGGELEGNDPDWIYAEINEEDGAYSVSYTIDANDGEARTAYIKVYTTDVPGNEEVYAIVTINQEEYVAPTYAELPFSFNGGRDDIETTDGLYQEGLGTDYNASTAPNTRLKFDGEGDWLLLQFNERPGTLTFDIKGNSFSGGTFKVQTSENGTTYTDLATYTELSDVQNEEFTDLGENVRYIKWIYTNKSNGNVGLGNITLAVYEAPQPSITFDPNVFDFDAGQHTVQLPFTYENIEVTNYASFTVHFYDAEGEEIQLVPGEAWCYFSVTGINDEGYQLTGAVIANEGEARSIYMKVSALDATGNTVYSNLVTVNQAAAPQKYNLTVEPFENLELITFVDDEMVMEEDGTIQVTEGAQVMLSIVADEGYVMETLMVNGVNHVNDIAGDFTYTFEMLAEDVTISATAAEIIAPAGGDYVRITSLDELTDGSIVVIAARYDEELTNEYYAMSNATSGKPTGVLFTSTTSGDNEILPASIVDNEDDYYWVVNETENGYTFRNAEGFVIGYTSSTNFATGGNNTEWNIELSTSEGGAMVPNYTGFFITNVNNQARHFALNSSHNFGPYHDNNINNSGYNFILDFFVQSDVTPITETYTIEIEGYGNSAGGYYLIASPVTVDPADVEGMIITGDDAANYDLYYFDQSHVGAEWRNYKQEVFDLVPGKGYLYAHKTGVTLTLTGVPYSGDGVIRLDYDENATLKGVNLVGNPFSSAASITKPFYVMKSTGDGFIASEGQIAPKQGIIVYASSDNEELEFTLSDPTSKSGITIDLNQVIDNRENSVIDRAIVHFDESENLPKYQLNPNSTKVYIPQDGNDFAVVNVDAADEIPVNFKASANGTYCLSVALENLELDALYLVDDLTGATVDLLANSNYYFDATTTDNANRFHLLFSTTGVNENISEASFAFVNGDGNIAINGMDDNCIVQLIDVTGRIIVARIDKGTISTEGMTPGVYVLRLVKNGVVRNQKLVIK